MKTSSKVGIAAVVVLVLCVGVLVALSAIEQSVKEVYREHNEWNDTDEGLKNAYCHTQNADWNYCIENTRVIKGLDGSSYAKMVAPTGPRPDTRSDCEIDKDEFGTLQKNYLKASSTEKPFMMKSLENLKDDLWNHCEINVQIQYN